MRKLIFILLVVFANICNAQDIIKIKTVTFNSAGDLVSVNGEKVDANDDSALYQVVLAINATNKYELVTIDDKVLIEQITLELDGTVPEVNGRYQIDENGLLFIESKRLTGKFVTGETGEWFGKGYLDGQEFSETYLKKKVLSVGYAKGLLLKAMVAENYTMKELKREGTKDDWQKVGDAWSVAIDKDEMNETQMITRLIQSIP